MVQRGRSPTPMRCLGQACRGRWSLVVLCMTKCCTGRVFLLSFLGKGDWEGGGERQRDGRKRERESCHSHILCEGFGSEWDVVFGWTVSVLQSEGRSSPRKKTLWAFMVCRKCCYGLMDPLYILGDYDVRRACTMSVVCDLVGFIVAIACAEERSCIWNQLYSPLVELNFSQCE